MPTMVGTITVAVTFSRSMRSIAPAGSNSGMTTLSPPVAGIERIADVDAAWNMGVWCSQVSRFWKSM